MLTPVQSAAVARASAPGFEGIELLHRPAGWPASSSSLGLSPAGSPRASPARLTPLTPRSLGASLPGNGSGGNEGRSGGLTRSRASSNATVPTITGGAPHIAVLDSSFNPPHLAHLALAASAFPPPIGAPHRSRALSSPRSPAAFLRDAASYFTMGHTSSATSPTGEDTDHLAPAEPDPTKGETVRPDPSPGPYTARLLMYSARNADKTPGAVDATAEQRAEMMLAMADDMPGGAGATAVAVVAEPTFVAKAEALVKLLQELTDEAEGGTRDNDANSGRVADVPEEAGNDTATGEPTTPQRPRVRTRNSGTAAAAASPDTPAITFLVGADTLLRIFDAKYYPPGGMDAALEKLFSHAWLVYARRGSGGGSTDADTRQQEDALLARSDVARWVARGRIRLIRTPDSVADVSSTRVRSALRMGAGAGALRGLCPDNVAKYLVDQKLYRR